MKALAFLLIIATLIAWWWYYKKHFDNWPSTIEAKVWQEFKIVKWQKAKLTWTSFSLELENLIRADCSWQDCIIGTWLVMKYTNIQEEQKWINLFEAYGHKIELKESDYKNFAKLIIKN